MLLSALVWSGPLLVDSWFYSLSIPVHPGWFRLVVGGLAPPHTHIYIYRQDGAGPAEIGSGVDRFDVWWLSGGGM